MSAVTRQTPYFDVGTLTSLVYLIIYFVVFYWFYSILKRIEKHLEEIKKTLQAKAPPAQAP